MITLHDIPVDLRQQLDECGDDLAAARAANRELMLRTNTTR